MGLPYPGGPQLAKLAESGTPGVFKFSRPMTDRPGLDFSFSGLKTQVLLAWKGSDQSARKSVRTLRAGLRMRWSIRWRSSARARWMRPGAAR